MKLFELFDKNLEFKHLKYSNGDVYQYKIPGIEHLLEIAIEIVEDKIYELTFSINEQFHLTNQNKSQFYIFSAVVQTVKNWLNQHPNNMIILQGNTNTQHRFYEKFFPSALKGYKINLSYQHDEYPEERLISIENKR